MNIKELEVAIKNTLPGCEFDGYELGSAGCSISGESTGIYITFVIIMNDFQSKHIQVLEQDVTTSFVSMICDRFLKDLASDE